MFPVNCRECNVIVSEKERQYSEKRFSQHLCFTCQKKFEKYKHLTKAAIAFYFGLKKYGLNPTLEHNDGHKTVDIALLDNHLYFEIDGIHHFEGEQAFADIQRNFFSWREGFQTFHIPNWIARNNKKLDEAAYFISDIIKQKKEKDGKK